MLSWEKKMCSLLLCIALILPVFPHAHAEEAVYMTRGEVADMLLDRALDYNPTLVRGDIIRGDATGELHEDRPVTRVEALTMLSRAFGELPRPVGANARNAYPSGNFVDIPEWAKTELDDVFRAGIVAGTSTTTFAPDLLVTDEQMQLFLQRVYALKGSDLKDDFYATVNKKELDRSIILPGNAGSGMFYDLSILSNTQILDIIQEVAEDPQTEVERKIATFYNNILDTDSRNALGIQPIAKYLDLVRNAQSIPELVETCNIIYEETGCAYLLGFLLSTDSKNSNRYVLTFTGFTPYLGTSSYANATQSQKNAYTEYVAMLLHLIGEPSDQAMAAAEQIWNMECTVAGASLPTYDANDASKTYNLYSMQQLQQLFPLVDLQRMLQTYGYTQPESILVKDPGALSTIAAYFSEMHLETLRAYCLFSVADYFGPFLNTAFTDAANAFNYNYYGVSSMGSIVETALYYTQQLMSEYLGQVYIERYFSEETKEYVKQMTEDIIAVFKERIMQLSWMSHDTKLRAISKLDTMVLNIGYPDTWTDPYADLTFRTVAEGGSFFENVIAIQRHAQKRSVALQFAPADHTGWLMSVYTVNAYYRTSNNSITFPAAILQSPFYSENASYEENLAGIGYLIAHEITHAFDNNGAKYDEKGNAANWWTEEDYAAFQTLCKRAIALYDGRESAPGIRCNGTLTLSENIADLGAVAAITDLLSRREEPDYVTFYTAMAQTWCSSHTRDYQMHLAMQDVHAADKLRVNVVLQNFDKFYETFDIDEDDAMWLPPEQRVIIW